ncbi:MAG: GNAT family N-acetyltransferase [Bacteroidota bacterium]
MSSKSLILFLAGHTDLQMRTIGKSDIENLRAWKNTNKHSFFLNQDITPAQQEKWYEAFSAREHDHMFVVEQLAENKWTCIGSMGFRKLEEESCVDAYNIIRAVKIEPASFTMSEAFLGMLAYADSLYPGLPIRVKVLNQNPAVSWYQRNGFTVIGTMTHYYLMELNKDSLSNINWSVK